MPRPSIKRQKLSTGEHISLGQAPEEVERVDLVEDQDSLAIQKQRADQIKAQQEASNKPIRLSTLTCVICLDNPTDLTATSCGHLFCHTCIMESLIAGENRAVAGEAKRSQCPVCRKNLSRTKAGDIIPLLMKKGLASQPRKSRTPGDP
ncbi:hypothetical protein M501DRAFT_935912 [Patellaria atrata CBS 101060]|uniref:RING-type domain-containing protein n=1 Tax=Patellaria atrata CBS 101060 TaxID=1346257 RepID=A0A9P4S9C6_9PEZI|nr:hypothetical protein M501DRAFT_935912 [Patellaria atrata CBS 101060]